MFKKTTCRILIFLIFVATTPSSPAAAIASTCWPQFRGFNAAGISSNSYLPDKWSATENVAWKTDLPGRSWSSPIVWETNIFVCAVINSGTNEPVKKGLYFGGERPAPPKTEHYWKVYNLDLITGAILWERTVHHGSPETPIHLKNSYGAETPVTDGERIYVLFGNVGVFALTLDGREAWSKRIEPRKIRYGWGTAASPVLHKGKLFIINDNDERAELFALDAKTGKELWRIERDEKSNWATPFIWQNGQREELITPGSRAVRSYGTDGNLLWSFRGMSSIAIPTPLAGDGLLFVSSGYVGDKLRPVYAIRPGATGDISLTPPSTTNEFIAWSNPVAGPYNPSPLYSNGRLYVLYDRGLISCFEAKTGKVLYDRERLPNGFAFTASPWEANGRIFCLNEDGVCFVVRSGDQFELMHTNKLADDDLCMASPAMIGDRLIIRTDKRLYCFRSNERQESAKQTIQSNLWWNQFRGPNGQGVALEESIPIHFGPETNALWKTTVPPGHSSPVIGNDYIFITANNPSNKSELITLAISRSNGNIRWQNTVRAEEKATFHPLNNPASSTAVTDERHVYVYFGTYGLLCYSHSGNKIWERKIPTPASKYGMATSPILYQNTVILALDGDNGVSRLLAFNKFTGDTAWERPRPLFKAGWSTPITIQQSGKDELIVLGSKRLTSYNPLNGEELWWAGGLPDETVSVPVYGDGIIFASAAALGGRGDDQWDAAATWKMTLDEFDRNRDGQIQRDEMTQGFAFIQRPELPKDNPGYGLPIKNMDVLLTIFDHDRNKIISEQEWMRTMSGFAAISHPTLVAIRSGATNDARKSHLAWEIHRGIPETASLLWHRGRLYLMRDGGLLTCLESATGKELFRERLGAPGQYIASPIAAKEKIIVASVAGIVTVLQADDRFKILGQNKLGEQIFATPAIDRNRLIIRTVSHMYAFGE